MGKSITVVGASVSTGARASDFQTKGWAGLLKNVIEPRGHSLRNAGVSGNKAIQILERLERDVLNHQPDIALFNMGLMNEQIKSRQEFDNAHRQWMELIDRCRNAGILPILGHCYGSTHYTPEFHEWLMAMNQSFELLDVPTVNFYGAVSDWTRASDVLPAADSGDGTHPNDAGHEQMFYAIPPSLFDYLDSLPVYPPRRSSDYLQLECYPSGEPRFTYSPYDALGAFTLMLTFRVADGTPRGSLLQLTENGSVRVAWEPNLAFVDDNTGVRINSQLSSTPGDAWHTVALSFNPLDEKARFYVDGECLGVVQTPGLTLTKLDIGPLAADGGPESTKVVMAYQEAVVYRTRLTDSQIKDAHEGRFMKASLELFAPMNAKSIEANGRFTNEAPTDSFLITIAR